MWTRVPDLLKGSGYVDLVGGDTQIDPASEQHVLNPAIAARRLLWLSTVQKTIDLAEKANPCLRIKNTSKNNEECNTIADV